MSHEVKITTKGGIVVVKEDGSVRLHFNQVLGVSTTKHDHTGTYWSNLTIRARDYFGNENEFTVTLFHDRDQELVARLVDAAPAVPELVAA